ncbi:SelT-like protein [Acorus gramineus]|uniref:SelT-like protein n=1 Tax=Acorus gramineus TaxID=55184 RepID=A0AAV9AK16_ACOGR|nr:SelT-like protein [Acorus gramineus]
MVGLPLFLLFSDLVSLFTPPPPPKPSHHHHHHHHHKHHRDSPPPYLLQRGPDFSSSSQVRQSHGMGFGNTISLSFCSSCSYRGTAVTMKKMLETSFPGIDVILLNHPPALPKRLLSKVVPAIQIGVIGIVMAGEQIFPRLGFMTPPPWYYQLRANRFGTIASTWLLGNMVQSYLQSTGAFEVYYNDDLIFSKLKEHRFPGELELRDLISSKLPSSKFMDNAGL